MAEEKKTYTQEERKRFFEKINAQRLEFFQEAAKNPKNRIVLCNTEESTALTELAIAADQQIGKIRNGLGLNISIQEGVDLLEELKGSIVSLEGTLQKMAALTGKQLANNTNNAKKLFKSTRLFTKTATQEETKKAV
ncbi:MAG: hypothetical protein RBR08_16165 [Desulforegulaceae bacterium]|nr:hypothetical protein [Desulforegulaceae bacterium]